ncbi:MAG: hypothetical protein KF861_05000 [Planctomycetaceae bacterium]|nr:hypothetical protein [Planctomycetaceae bacterium]
MARSPLRPHFAARTPCAWDDPVPPGSSVDVIAPHRVDVHPYAVETAVRKKLTAQDGVHFLELVVRRVPDGVCLEGVMQTDNECLDIADLVRQCAGIDRVINHLLILPTTPVSREDEDVVAVIG